VTDRKKTIINRMQITRALGELGVLPGDCLIAHTSLRAFGYVEGGSLAVVDAVLDAVGREGTVVFPTFTGRNVTDYDASIEDLIYTGTVPKAARLRDDFVKSMHPLYSICAKGPLAAELCERNDRYIFPAARHKFLHWMGERGGKALLLGCGHESNSSVHLVEELGELEYKVQDKPYWSLTVETFLAMSPSRQAELRKLHNGSNLDYVTECHFNAIEGPLKKADVIRFGKAGEAALRLMRIADVERVGLAAVKDDPWLLRKKVAKP
jgi:aminoglycoside 3-N-acetyltransferase